MFCKNCGAEIDDKAVICVKCGCSTVADSASPTQEISNATTASEKSRLIALLLCTFFGIIGVHRFYLGRIGSGIGMIFTLGGLGIWLTIDWIIILCGTFKDNDGKIVTNWNV